MLRPEQVEAVRELLAAEVSQREISRITGISRDTIHRIFKGLRPDNGRVANRCPAKQDLHSQFRRDRIIGRCTECGALVHLPCLACHIRQECPSYGDAG